MIWEIRLWKDLKKAWKIYESLFFFWEECHTKPHVLFLSRAKKKNEKKTKEKFSSPQTDDWQELLEEAELQKKA